jgi:hypothetical protein
MSLAKIDSKRLETLILLGASLGFFIWYWDPQFGRTINFTLLLVQYWFPEVYQMLLNLF